MKKIGGVLILLCALSMPVNADEMSVSIGINLYEYPELELMPGYPVYYAPQLNANYFFYDGSYWVYYADNWYVSDWYDGPWQLVDPVDVPDFILRIPVRFYLSPPVFFLGWYFDEPPHWGEHWGHDWERHRRGWDRWDRRIHVKPAPLPTYQRQYSADRYPRQFEQQHELEQKNYRYRARDPFVQQRRPQVQRAPSPQPRMPPPERGRAVREDNQRVAPNPPSPRAQPQQGEVIRQPEQRRELREQRSRGREEERHGDSDAREPRGRQMQDRGQDR